MPVSDRRTLIQAAAAIPLAMATSTAAFPQATEAPSGGPANSAPMQDVTGALARYLVTAAYGDLPGNVRKEGVRTLLIWTGVAIGGSRHETVEIAVAALTPFSGPAQASLLGRRERFDIMNAAFINGVSSHIFDFDDTHLKTIIHPAGPVASAILALSEIQPVSGKDFLNALVLGVETECRIGNAVYPNHYDVGWHITGTAGVFGSAAAVGKLLKSADPPGIARRPRRRTSARRLRPAPKSASARRCRTSDSSRQWRAGRGRAPAATPSSRSRRR